MWLVVGAFSTVLGHVAGQCRSRIPPSLLGSALDNTCIGSIILINQSRSLGILFTKMAPPTYIISRVGDPIFALVIGLSAAATRINREGTEKGRTTQQTIEAGKRYIRQESS